MKKVILIGFLSTLNLNSFCQKIELISHNKVYRISDKIRLEIKNDLGTTMYYFISGEIFTGDNWREFRSDVVDTSKMAELIRNLPPKKSKTFELKPDNYLRYLVDHNGKQEIRFVLHYGPSEKDLKVNSIASNKIAISP